MSKEINLEKIKKEYQRGDLSEMIDTHIQIGQWLQDLLKEREKTINELRQSLFNSSPPISG